MRSKDRCQPQAQTQRKGFAADSIWILCSMRMQIRARNNTVCLDWVQEDLYERNAADVVTAFGTAWFATAAAVPVAFLFTHCQEICPVFERCVKHVHSYTNSAATTSVSITKISVPYPLVSSLTPPPGQFGVQGILL